VIRRLLTLVVLTAALAGAALATGIAPAAADSPSVSRKDAIAKVQEVRGSIDRTLALIKAGQSEQAFEEAKDGYLNHFELVEIPLRVADNSLTIKAESLFAEIRTMIRNDDPEGQIRDKIVELRGVMDDVERKLTSTGLTAPALVLGQSFLIIFREGFEVILLLSVLLGYLEAAKSRQYMKPILAGVGIAAIATVLTVLLFRTIFAALPVGQEMLEAITALIAVAMLFYVSFWLIARLEHKRWLEFVKARMWSAVSVGSALSLMIVGFTAVYREGFETALFYQALISFGTGLGVYILAGLFLGIAALAVVAWLMFRLGRKLPIKTFMNIAVVLVMATSVAFLGNAVHALQAADRVPFTPLAGWPRPPIFLSEATGYWPTVQTVTAQIVLTAIYVMGGIYVFLVKPRLAKRAVAVRPIAPTAAPA
jgi:high-affinity iron transporter